MPDDRGRQATNISQEQADSIRELAKKEKRNFSQMTRVLLDEALALRENEKVISIEQAKRSFPEWGKQGVKKLMIEGLEFLASNDDGEVEAGQVAIAFLQKLAEQAATNGDAIELADLLNTKSLDTAFLSNLVKFSKKGHKSTNGI